MSVRIIAVEPANLPKDTIKAHEAMESFTWVSDQDQGTGVSTREVMYEWVVNKKGKAYVVDNTGKQILVFGMVTPSGKKIIRTAENGVWSDLLIGLETQAKPQDAS